jgi:RHH-type proline utilization regulon transcriptional repressor/proline dehydrogenase/delta 1-pyrroline-5-carboxylate dehydrogenase
MVDGNPYLWTPGIKYGVQAGLSYHPHDRVFRPPMLGVMWADHLDHAIELVNQTPYGLTSGIESLDKREQAYWKDRVRAGNLYVNRGTTGAITLRQPFGGMEKSALGPGRQGRGHPDYVAQFMTFEETGYPRIGAISGTTSAVLLRDAGPASDCQVGKTYRNLCDRPATKPSAPPKAICIMSNRPFPAKTDFFHLRGQDNLLRYLPVGRVVIRLHEQDSVCSMPWGVSSPLLSPAAPPSSVFRRGWTMRWFNSSPPGTAGRSSVEPKGGRKTIKTLIDMMPEASTASAMRRRIGFRRRFLSPLPKPGSTFRAPPVLMEGRIELLQYFRQQSICDNYHRYGNLGERSLIA